MPARIRILLLADTHLGFDLPARPRVRRRRRGHDFLANYAKALEPALAGRVDVVVHGGDVFHRPRVPASVAYEAFEPLVRVADRGVPVFLVPGNHERGRLPHRGLAVHRGIHVFDRPGTVLAEVRGVRVALAGFPYERRGIRTRFAEVLEGTGWRGLDCAARLLCMHQCVEGATVGPGDYTFTTAADVIRGRDIPGAFAAVLSGHIHRHQVLTSDRTGRTLAAPVLYPGSIERTSLAERGEVKGFMVVDVETGGAGGRAWWEFRPLPARPLVVRELHVDGVAFESIVSKVRAILAGTPADAVLRLRVMGVPTERVRRYLTAANLRAMAPATMNVEIRSGDHARRDLRFARRSPAPDLALELPFPPVGI